MLRSASVLARIIGLSLVTRPGGSFPILAMIPYVSEDGTLCG
jgi:hypothetical protein